MLETSISAPVLSGVTMDGDIYKFPSNSTHKSTLIYFFAPWCKICHLSIENLNILRGQVDESELAILIVALDWTSKTEVADFLAKHDLDFPVILGDKQWQQQYKIKGFPSYYVIDENNKISSKSMGYTSTVGLIRRSIF